MSKSAATLVALPHEIKIFILENLSDIQTLKSLIFSCRTYYTTFKSSQDTILLHAFNAELQDNTNIAILLLNAQLDLDDDDASRSDSRFFVQRMAEKRSDVYRWPWEGVVGGGWLSVCNDEEREDRAASVRMLYRNHRAVKALAKRLFEFKLRINPRINSFTEYKPPSDGERLRVYTALYHIFFSLLLFRDRENKNGESEESLSEGDFCWFLAPLWFWPLEHFRTMLQFLRDALSPYVNAVYHDAPPFIHNTPRPSIHDKRWNPGYTDYLLSRIDFTYLPHLLTLPPSCTTAKLITSSFLDDFVYNNTKLQDYMSTFDDTMMVFKRRPLPSPKRCFRRPGATYTPNSPFWTLVADLSVGVWDDERLKGWGYFEYSYVDEKAGLSRVVRGGEGEEGGEE